MMGNQFSRLRLISSHAGVPSGTVSFAFDTRRHRFFHNGEFTLPTQGQVNVVTVKGKAVTVPAEKLVQMK